MTPSAGDGFFAHHGLWAPGVRLFRRLGFRAKAWLISVLFVVPIAALGAAYVRQVVAVMEMTQREDVGISYARETLALLGHLEHQRMLAIQGSATGSAAADLGRAGEQVARQMQRLEAYEARFGDQLATAEAFSVLRANVDKAARAAKGNPLAAYKRQSQAVEAAFILLDQVTNRSGLAIDPDLGLHHLLDAVMAYLPPLVDSSLALADLGLVVQRGGNREMVLASIVSQRALAAHLDAQVRGAVENANAAHPEFGSSLSYAPTEGALTKLQDLTASATEAEWSAEAAALLGARQAMTAQAASLQVAIFEKIDVLLNQRVRRVNTELALIVGVLGVSLLLAAYMFISFSRVMQGGLAEVRRHLRAMTDGDLTTVPRPWGRDEAAHLMFTLREMQDALRGIVTQVRQSSEGIVSGSQVIARDAAELSARSEESATSLQRSATSMSEIEVIVRDTAKRAGEATQIGRANRDAAERGGQVIGNVIATMEDIQGASRQIGEITGVIDGIAFQTNILALNAAVEAAHAGDQGRGFAVVAAEVRSLAQRSATAAREIKALVGSSVEKVSTGVSVVQTAGTVIGEIVEASQRVNGLLAQIAESTSAQARSVTDVGATVGEVDSVTQLNTALVQEAAAAAAELQTQARILSERVTKFRLPGEPAVTG